MFDGRFYFVRYILVLQLSEISNKHLFYVQVKTEIKMFAMATLLTQLCFHFTIVICIYQV